MATILIVASPSGKDRSPSPDLPGPQAFGWHILNVSFPLWYRPLTNVPKYSGETNPGLWLKNYRLCKPVA